MALSDKRNTPELGIVGGGFVERVEGVEANAVCHAGGLACVDATGYAKPGETATGLISLGRFEESKDNTGGANGDLEVRIKPGVFKFSNSGSSIAADDVGKTCYIVDDEAVHLTDGGGTRSAAGKIVRVDTDGGVFVAVGLAAIFA